MSGSVRLQARTVRQWRSMGMRPRSPLAALTHFCVASFGLRVIWTVRRRCPAIYDPTLPQPHTFQALMRHREHGTCVRQPDEVGTYFHELGSLIVLIACHDLALSTPWLQALRWGADSQLASRICCFNRPLDLRVWVGYTPGCAGTRSE